MALLEHALTARDRLLVMLFALTGNRIEELLELTHHSFVAYAVPTTGEVVPMHQIAPSNRP